MANIKSASIVENNKSHDKKKAVIELRKEIEGKLTSPNDLKKVPSSLSEEAKKEYKRLIKLYNKLEVEIWGILDENLLVMYCEAVVKYKGFNSLYYDEDIDEATKDKLLKKINDQIKIIALLSDKLCLTPLMRIQTAQKIAKRELEEKKDPLEEIGF